MSKFTKFILEALKDSEVKESPESGIVRDPGVGKPDLRELSKFLKEYGVDFPDLDNSTADHGDGVVGQDLGVSSADFSNLQPQYGNLNVAMQSSNVV